MLRFVILSLALIALINSSNIPRTTATPPGKKTKDRMFVLTACNSTKYPITCYKALSPYSSTIKSNPIKLCLAAVSVNLKSAKKASSVVSSLLKKFASSPEVQDILKDCLTEMKDAADEIKEEIASMLTKPPMALMHLKSKLEKWVNSTLPYRITCMDKFKEVKMMNAEIKKVMKAVTELSLTTSNTLALITRYLRF